MKVPSKESFVEGKSSFKCQREAIKIKKSENSPIPFDCGTMAILPNYFFYINVNAERTYYNY